jgi:signal transduction histidine kinase
VTHDILIVDDNRPNLLALESTLEPLGERITLARSGSEALAAIDRARFVLILLDVRMPDLDGFEVASLIRQHEHGRETPIIFLTAIDTNPADARRGLSLGAVDYIYKPYDPEVVRNKVQSFMTLHREREARREAETAVRMKDLILGVIGHDLLSPLTAIQTSAHVALRNPTLNGDSLGRILSASQRMQRMITALVDYAQTQPTGRLQIKVTPRRMDDLCRQVIDEALAIHPERDIALDIDGDPSGSWDGDRVIQALGNLVGNALKHSKGPVRIQIDGGKDNVAVGVESEGRPFPESVRAHLFSPFRKGDPHGAGLGLGLYIVRTIATAHGAEVALTTSEGDRRTAFVIRWPRVPKNV